MRSLSRAISIQIITTSRSYIISLQTMYQATRRLITMIQRTLIIRNEMFMNYKNQCRSGTFKHQAKYYMKTFPHATKKRQPIRGVSINGSISFDCLSSICVFVIGTLNGLNNLINRRILLEIIIVNDSITIFQASFTQSRFSHSVNKGISFCLIHGHVYYPTFSQLLDAVT